MGRRGGQKSREGGDGVGVVPLLQQHGSQHVEEADGVGGKRRPRDAREEGTTQMNCLPLTPTLGE